MDYKYGDERWDFQTQTLPLLAHFSSRMNVSKMTKNIGDILPSELTAIEFISIHFKALVIAYLYEIHNNKDWAAALYRGIQRIAANYSIHVDFIL